MIELRAQLFRDKSVFIPGGVHSVGLFFFLFCFHINGSFIYEYNNHMGVKALGIDLS